jgi:hypothetical protein
VLYNRTVHQGPSYPLVSEQYLAKATTHAAILLVDVLLVPERTHRIRSYTISVCLRVSSRIGVWLNSRLCRPNVRACSVIWLRFGGLLKPPADRRPLCALVHSLSLSLKVSSLKRGLRHQKMQNLLSSSLFSVLPLGPSNMICTHCRKGMYEILRYSVHLLTR